MTDTQATSPYTGRPIDEWLDEKVELKDADGDKIGDVVEVNPDFVVAESDGGFLGLGERRLYYVPRSHIAREDGEDWYLSIDKDQVEAMDWRNAPAESTWSTDWSQGEASLDTTERREGTRIRRYEEELDVRKVDRQAGEVTVTKNVVEDTKTVEVPVRREEVHVERRAVSGEASNLSSDDAAFSGESIRVPVMEEDVEVRKVPRAVEEIEITKSATEDTKRVEETVRREEVDVDDTTRQTQRSTTERVDTDR
jgi:uncharacterized protein (TIGR02271 family)